MRYRHYLTRPRVTRWPKRVACIAVNDFGIAHIVTLILADGDYEIDKSVNNLDQWQVVWFVQYLAKHGGETWILSYQCARVWSLTNLWECIENGTYQLTGTDPREADIPMGGVRDMPSADASHPSTEGRHSLPRLPFQAEGVLIAEDPPNIITFRCPPGAGKLTWIDCRNHGVDLSVPPQHALATCQQLVGWFQDYHRACTEADLGSACTTSASQAMHGWRKSYMPDGVYAHADATVLRMEGQSYYGGRAECFRIGKIKSHSWHYDVRSMYGYVMAHYNMPYRLIDYVEGVAADSLVRKALDLHVVADVDVETNEPAYPVRRDRDVIWPVGRFRTTLPNPELIDALLCHRVGRCHAAALYDAAPILKEYAEDMYSLRVKYNAGNNPRMEAWCKRMIVSIAGKLGQREHKWQMVSAPGNVPPYGEWYGTNEAGEQCRYRSIGGVVMRDVPGGYMPDAIPSVAACITSHGRRRLLGLIRSVGWENVYYVDTDGLIVNDIGGQLIEKELYGLGYEMGDLRRVWDGCGLSIMGIKHYAQGDKVVMAGMGRGVVQDAGDGVHYLYSPAPQEQMRRGHKPDNRQIELRYASALSYHHGHVRPSGVVDPIVLEEW